MTENHYENLYTRVGWAAARLRGNEGPARVTMAERRDYAETILDLLKDHRRLVSMTVRAHAPLTPERRMEIVNAYWEGLPDAISARLTLHECREVLAEFLQEIDRRDDMIAALRQELKDRGS